MMKQIVYCAILALIVGALCVSPARASLTNGGFETGDFSGWTCPVANCGDATGNPYWMNVNAFPHSGNYAAHLGAWGPNGVPPVSSTISQTLTLAAGTYDISFWYGEYNNNPVGVVGQNGYDVANGLSLVWNGSTTFADTNFFTTDLNPLAAQGDGFWKQATVTVTATAGDNELTFSAYDQMQDIVLDDITMTPEPGFYGVLAVGLTGLAFGIRRRRSA